ncbi:hypothetical protein T439DRAFT_175698 [Meredithblackwellia eburnea MCA 4105]
MIGETVVDVVETLVVADEVLLPPARTVETTLVVTAPAVSVVGWGAEEGKDELAAEVQGAQDAADAVASATPAAEDGAATPVDGAPAPRARRGRRDDEEEEEDTTLTLDQYLAAQAEKKLNVAELPSARAANEGADDSQWKDAVALARKGDQEEEWFTGVKKTETKAKKQKEGKTFLEIDTYFKPPRRDGPPRDGARGGGRGGPRGGRGGPRGGAARGAGAPRGGKAAAGPAVNVEDSSAFPALA